MGYYLSRLNGENMAEFSSERSQRVRGELTDGLVAVVDKAIVHVDFSLICGLRTLEGQQHEFALKHTHLDGIIHKSKHQTVPKARAFDFVPYPLPDNDWMNRPLFTHYAGFFIGIAWEKGIELTWGGDWDNDFRWRDQHFHDFPHIEER